MSILLLILIPFLLTSGALLFTLKTTPRISLERPKRVEPTSLDLHTGADHNRTATRI